jgi:hypothetical protein
MYVYLPAYKKIRRIASHVRNQGFMGTAFSYDEISIVTYGDVFTGQLTGENDKEWMVTATRRPGQEFSYAKLEFVISKEFHQPTSVKYYNDKGVLLKTETRTGYECADSICTPKTLHLVDHTRNGLSSKMVWTSWKRNTGIADSAFTQRDLQR